VKLGNPNLKRDNKVRQEKALAFAETLRPTLEAFIQGKSQRYMVNALNQTGVKTRRGRQWNLNQLQAALKRLGLKTERSKA